MFLEHLHQPADLQKLNTAQLTELCQEIRNTIISTVAENGGHLAASLGTVELIVALHKTFQSPEDTIFFDVGHQAYAHKLLTGRQELFSALRQYQGCAGFPTPAESIHDPAAAGHAGTAISLALGNAAASSQAGQSRKAIAVVGDGALTCGISWEALDMAKAYGQNLLVILNDNQMSIQPNVGAMARCLNRLISGKMYNRFRRGVIRVVEKSPCPGRLRNLIRRLEDSLKGLLLPPGALFQELGLRYLGPIDGHDLSVLLEVLARARNLSGPLILHVLTEKGRGCDFASTNPTRYHGVSGYSLPDGVIAPPEGGSFTAAFSQAMVELGRKHPELEAVSAAMIPGTGLLAFQQNFPQRCHDVGIAEAHAVSFSAGLASAGRRPVCAIYATFLQRALDCLYTDVLLSQLPVIFACDRAGVVEDGPTHHGIYDLAFLRALPGLVIMQPASTAELVAMLNWAYDLKQPVLLRYPKGTPWQPDPDCPPEPLQLGQAALLPVPGGAAPRLLLWGLGAELRTASAVAAILLQQHQLPVQIVNPRFMAPFPAELARKFAYLPQFSIEDHCLSGGLYSALTEALGNQPHQPVQGYGWPADAIIPHGKPQKLREVFGLTAEAIAADIAARMQAYS